MSEGVKVKVGITIVITRNDIIKMIESCFQRETPEETLKCLHITLKLLLLAVENTLEQIEKHSKR